MEFCKESHVLPVFASKALTEARSVLLKILEIIPSFSCALICPIELFKSPRMSLSERMLPLESYTSTPNFLKSLEAESVGF